MLKPECTDCSSTKTLLKAMAVSRLRSIFILFCFVYIQIFNACPILFFSLLFLFFSQTHTHTHTLALSLSLLLSFSHSFPLFDQYLVQVVKSSLDFGGSLSTAIFLSCRIGGVTLTIAILTFRSGLALFVLFCDVIC